ncbi:hypothetical protein R6Q57_011107 [Mikania cordata]
MRLTIYHKPEAVYNVPQITMSTHTGKHLLWLCFMSVLLIKTTGFTYYFCEQYGNYTNNSIYQTNLDTALSTLPNTNTGIGFFNHSVGQGPDRVNSAALCRGDVEPDLCLACLNDSVVRLLQLCPNQKGAVGYYVNCWLKYTNTTILQNPPHSVRLISNVQNASGRDRFDVSSGSLLNSLITEAAAGDLIRKFACRNTSGSGSGSGSGSTIIYGLVQCVPDLTQVTCSSCLKDAIDNFTSQFSWSIGGRFLQPMCNFRYEIYPFFNVTSSPSPLPPPTTQISQATPPVSSPPQGTNFSIP